MDDSKRKCFRPYLQILRLVIHNKSLLAFSIQPLAFLVWRRWMGIEPTWDFVEPHTGFEDQERHQVAPHLHDKSPRRWPIAG